MIVALPMHPDEAITAAVEPSALTGEVGAYVLDLRLVRPRSFETGLLGPVRLREGRYLYVGSAYGPGGLRARIARHLRIGKRPRWHIDHLTEHAERIEVIAVPGGRECDVATWLRTLSGVTVPVAGFGSSDCKRCPAHLYFWSSDDPVQTLADGLLGMRR